MTAKDAVVIADVASALGTVATALLIARLTDITSDMSSALKGGADDGQRTSGKRKGASNGRRYVCTEGLDMP